MEESNINTGDQSTSLPGDVGYLFEPDAPPTVAQDDVEVAAVGHDNRTENLDGVSKEICFLFSGHN